MADITMLPTAGDKPWDVPLNQAITNINVDLENTIGVPPGGAEDQVLIKASATDFHMEWSTLAGSGLVPDASTTTKGIVELATNGETTTGTDTVRAVTPAGLKAAQDAQSGDAAVNTVAASGAAETLSAAYQLHKVTMDQACTFTFTSPTAGAVFAVLLSGAFTPTWPGSVKWPSGALPAYTTPALYVFATFDGGTTWQGVQSGKAYA
jgi:hypothetical protein